MSQHFKENVALSFKCCLCCAPIGDVLALASFRKYVRQEHIFCAACLVVVSNNVKNKIRERARQSYLRNRDIIRARSNARYYEKRAEILKCQNNRYANDTEHRAKKVGQSKAYYEAIKRDPEFLKKQKEYREKNRAKRSAWNRTYQRTDPVQRARKKEYAAQNRRTIADQYIRNIFRAEGFFRGRSVPPALIEAKRAHLLLLRELEQTKP